MAANDSIKSGLDLIGEFIVDQLVKTIDDLGHRTTGRLQDTMRSVVTSSGKGYDITIYGQDYAKYVEKGVPAGVWVSVDKLARWVHDKGIATGEREIKNLAYAIQRKIYDKGSVQFRKNKKGFVEVTLDANANIIFQMVFDLFSREVAISLRNTIAKQRKIFQT
jgi:hypothetical protein